MGNEYLNVAIKASLKAGQAILKIYGQEDFGVDSKDDNSPLTLADKDSNEVINSFLTQTPFPIISEENKQAEYLVRKSWDICWIVDPLDGTKEFIKRNGEFTVNIALVKNGKPSLGVIYVPVTGELYYADVEEGKAYKATVNYDISVDAVFGKSEMLVLNDAVNDKIIRVVGSRSHMTDDTLEFIGNLKSEYPGLETEIVSKGSSLKFCLVAEGKADVYPRFAPTMEWDTAAGQAICEAVGLKVITKDTGKPMLYNKENLLNSYFVVRK
ncbi:3'(2'),5'-bisphosphate nucleotidase CysQ [Flavobacterium rhizosphaerae]|uniref:3'(2'),5'-bisphosphate nucleotidase CysQ n=1 Tax=Flavobacterium rhizosphaerae TaxID=3163298 RepID=A0ABW8YY84_9FLAO